MNRSTTRMIERNHYYELNKRRIWIAGTIILFMLLIFSVCFITKTVTAQKDSERSKLVTSIEVKKGDTLWEIASEYVTDEYDDLNEYIEEIMDSNGLITDEIHVGNYIIVPYYADASSAIMNE